MFIEFCHAVQHAHQKGIIHRDLKPSNILVSRSDSAPSAQPKVIDFGIAKAAQGRLTDATLMTVAEHFIGTPAYMSPEQAEPGAHDIDTRTDIYALGVILYELLTAHLPFERPGPNGSVDDIRRAQRALCPRQISPTPPRRRAHRRRHRSPPRRRPHVVDLVVLSRTRDARARPLLRAANRRAYRAALKQQAIANQERARAEAAAKARP